MVCEDFFYSASLLPVRVLCALFLRAGTRLRVGFDHANMVFVFPPALALVADWLGVWFRHLMPSSLSALSVIFLRYHPPSWGHFWSPIVE